MVRSLRAAVQEARRSKGLYFQALLSEECIDNAFGAARARWQGELYTPAMTVWLFLAQCFSAAHACQEVVLRLIAWRVGQGLKPCSPATGGYCWARSRLPEETCHALLHETARQAEQTLGEQHLWCGRRVLVADGSSVTMADTPENQAEYPQQASQKPGCGFPLARVVVLFSLAAGVVLDAAVGSYRGKGTGETSLLRRLWGCFQRGDVLLADRNFSGWCDLIALAARGVDVVVRKNSKRSSGRLVRRLGKEDQLTAWAKPAKRPAWLSPEQFAALPEELLVREVVVPLTRPGFRTKRLVVVTTLLDAQRYRAASLTELYRRRWEAELNLRSLKEVLKMDHLRCKTPERVRNELRMHLIAYNLIRRVMIEAALRAGVRPQSLSFTYTLEAVLHFLPELSRCPSVGCWVEALLDAVAAHRVGNRPNRSEPRRTKHRPKRYGAFRETRTTYRQRLLTSTV